LAAVIAPKPKDFDEHVREVQAQLADSAQRAGLGRDPYGRVVEAQSAAMGLWPELIASIQSARLPVRDEDMRRAVVQGISVHAGATVRAMGWRNVLIAAGLLFATTAIGAAGGYWFGRTTEAAKYVHVATGLNAALAAPEAAEWLSLIRLNNIKQANRTCEAQAGGVACSISLWTKAAPAR
jgi:hypothetical protein